MGIAKYICQPQNQLPIPQQTYRNTAQAPEDLSKNNYDRQRMQRNQILLEAVYHEMLKQRKLRHQMWDSYDAIPLITKQLKCLW